MLDEGTPIFLQIADQLSSDIVDGTLAEGDRVPSTNEFAAFYRINPATAAKGINVLVDDGDAGKAPRHRHVRRHRRPGPADRAAPQGICRAVRRSTGHRGQTARHRHRGIDRDDPAPTRSDQIRADHRTPSNAIGRRRGVMTPIVAGRPRHPPLPRDHRTGRRVSTALQADTITGLLGPQRRRQVHPDADHHRPGVRQLGHGPGRRAEPAGERRRARPDDVRQGEPDLSRHQGQARAGSRVLVLPELGCRAGRSADGGLRAARPTGPSRSCPAACIPRSASSSGWPPGPRSPCSTSPTWAWMRWPGRSSTTGCWPITPSTRGRCCCPPT